LVTTLAGESPASSIRLAHYSCGLDFPAEIILICCTKRNSNFAYYVIRREIVCRAQSLLLVSVPQLPDGITNQDDRFVMKELSHIDEQGRMRMVDTSAKMITSRRAVASARVLMSREAVAALSGGRTPKGDPLEAARLAGIMAAKKTSELIPLCHPLPLTHIEVRASIDDAGVHIESEVATNAQTGVEMEALTAVAVAALTVYDMCKALDKGIRITEVRLESKTGGKSGDYRREKTDF
jgi:cyclic pyranopterin phosphate synthase